MGEGWGSFKLAALLERATFPPYFLGGSINSAFFERE